MVQSLLRPVACLLNDRQAWLGPAMLSITFVLVLSLLLWSFRHQSLQNERTHLQMATAASQETIQRRLAANEEHLAVLGRDVGAALADRETFEQHALRYLQEHPELVAIAFVEPDLTVRWLAPEQSMIIGDQQKLALTPSRQAAERALDNQQRAYTPFISAATGMSGFEVYVPAVYEDEVHGVVLSVYSADRLLRHVLPREVIQAHRLRLLGPQDQVLAGLPTVGRVDERLRSEVPITPPGHGIQLQFARYGPGMWGQALSLLALLCVALVVGMGYGLWSLNRQVARRRETEAELREMHKELEQRVRQRTAELEAANTRLRQEMIDRQAAEQRSRQHQELLARVGRITTMGEMAAGLAHELNQPLGAIASFSQGCLRLLDANVPDMHVLREALGEMKQESLRAGRIIHRLREFVAERQPERTSSDVRQLIEDVLDLLAPEAKQHRITQRLTMEHETLHVKADAVQLQQILVNLVRNAMEALQAMPPDHREIIVSAERTAQNEVRIAVADTGPGCDPSSVNYLFDAFYTTKPTGLGMGLAISRSIVEAHGGHLAAVPGAEGGMTVWFTIPDVEEETA